MNTISLSEDVSLPTATGQAEFRLAATNTNFGWPTGVIFINATD